MSIGYFEIISEYIVEAYLEALYAGGLALALLQFEQVIFAVVGYLTQIVEFGVDTLRITSPRLSAAGALSTMCDAML